MMEVAPYNACVACFKGDTSTGFALRGEAEFIVAGIRLSAGIPLGQAKATFSVYASQDLGCDPGMVPTGEVEVAIRLCSDCAEKTGTGVGGLGRDTLPGYDQKSMFG